MNAHRGAFVYQLLLGKHNNTFPVYYLLNSGGCRQYGGVHCFRGNATMGSFALW